ANVVAYISDPGTASSGTVSCTWAEVTAPGGHVAVAELVAGEGVRATASIAAETARRMDRRPAVRRRPCHRRHRRPGHRQRTASMSARAEEEHMEIDTLEGVQLGGITHRIRVRGADASNPVLLLMQQGPGLPIINDARRLERLLGLEKAFTVIYWDQRGTGLSSPSL